MDRGLTEVSICMPSNSRISRDFPTHTSRVFSIADDMIKLDKQEQEDPRARRGGGMGGMPGM